MVFIEKAFKKLVFKAFFKQFFKKVFKLKKRVFSQSLCGKVQNLIFIIYRKMAHTLVKKERKGWISKRGVRFN